MKGGNRRKEHYAYLSKKKVMEENTRE